MINKMKNKQIIKIAGLIIIFIAFMIMMTGCNKDLIDTNYEFNKAIICLNDGTKMEIEIKQWTDYEGEQIQIISKEGTIYLVSSYNTILINEK